ncbi:hypothetical protein ACQEVI_27285 [Promicromonospora sp. CA-289599]|uniref:hypothetical protein n=1 Tax=Promicromonospora sp. CA-289599 TaxID=3240014 RepID=UPI003D8FBA3B
MTPSRTPRLATRLGSAVAIVALGLSLAACSAEPDPGAEPVASEVASAPTEPSPSPTKTKLTAEEKAVKHAEKVLREYYRLDNVAMQAPEKFDPKKFEKVAIGSGLTHIQSVYSGVSYAGQHRVGEVQIDSVKVQKVDLTNKPKQTPPEIPFVEFIVCIDISNMDTLGKDGESTKPANGKSRLVYGVGVANYEYPNGPWLVDGIESMESETC